MDPAPFNSGNSHTVFSLLSEAFQRYTEISGNESSESYRKKLAECEEKWQASGLQGDNSVQLLSQLKQQIGWEIMGPDQFSSFYRFVFCICKEPRRKFVQINVALALWRLVLPGRFRRLDHWCDFVARQHSFKVVSEDQWRQVLDFSRIVYEDLSNFDPSGAWVCVLDDFVEHLHSSQHHPPVLNFIRPDSIGMNSAGSSMLLGEVSPQMRSVSPSCGSKRKNHPADIDIVAEQLSTLPLSSVASNDLDTQLKRLLEIAPKLKVKKQCMATLPRDSMAEVPFYQYLQCAIPQQQQQFEPMSSTSVSGLPVPAHTLHIMQCAFNQNQHPLQQGDTNMGVSGMQDLPLLPALLTQRQDRRVLRTRRSSVAELVSQSVSDALEFL